MNILAIESSCDETAAAIITDGTRIVSSVVASSHEMHKKYGGIVPEVAARIQLESVIPVITEALGPLQQSPGETMLETIEKNIDAIAVTVGPGLIGSLLVGVETAKTIAYATGKPIIPVNHVLAHMYANFVQPVIASDNEANSSGSPHSARDDNIIEFPAISLVVSGGHTELYLMKNKKELVWLGGTIDDAAGECFDKTARLLGFGHGGGLAIQQAAEKIPNTKTQFTNTLPRPMLGGDNLHNFSFSGLKTAIVRVAQSLQTGSTLTEQTINELSYEVQETITDVLVKKTLRAAEMYKTPSILLSGGVSANIRLREKFARSIEKDNLSLVLHAPPVPLCTDNAVYIGSYAFFRGEPVSWKDINAFPDLSVEVSH